MYLYMNVFHKAFNRHSSHAVEQVHALLSTLGGAQKLLNDVVTEETFLMQTRSRGLGMTNDYAHIHS